MDDGFFSVVGVEEPQPVPRPPPEQHGLVCIQRVTILNLNLYEFEASYST